MKNWFNRNYKTLIITAFLIPIITVAIVSISHVTQWYGISNPITWSVYLSIGIEIAALSALAAISANMGSKVYFPFIVVTLIQFIGNIFFAYSFIDVASQQFKDWVLLVSPLLEIIGVDSTDYIGHKRFLSVFAGGMLPIISLSFLHMLVKFTEEDRNKEQKIVEEETKHLIDDEIIKQAIEKYKLEQEELSNLKVKENDIEKSLTNDEILPVKLTEDQLKKLEEILLREPNPKVLDINEPLEIIDDIYEPTVEEETQNFNDSIEQNSSLEIEPEVEITNTTFNQFNSDAISSIEEYQENVYQNPQTNLFVTKEVIDETNNVSVDNDDSINNTVDNIESDPQFTVEKKN
jgi:hypothetical protein